jgi:hypothetical protein
VTISPSQPASLSSEALAVEAGVGREYVLELAQHGAIRPDAAGLYTADDIPRVRLASALASGGIDTEALMWAIDTKILMLDEIGGSWRKPDPGGRPYGEFLASIGPRGTQLGAVYAAFGLVEPPTDAPISQEEERLLVDYLDTWEDVDPDPELARRAARVLGEGMRRLQLAVVDLFDEWGARIRSVLRAACRWMRRTGRRSALAP